MKGRSRVRIALASGFVTSVLVAIVACTATLQGTLALITGPDNGFTQSPQPTSLRVQLIAANGVATTLAQTALPAPNGVSLPAQPSTGIDTLQVTGFDEKGDAVVSGATIPLALDQLSGITLNLFMQRTGQFSRLPSADGGTATLDMAPSEKPLLTTLYSRYLLISDGTGKSNATQLYDTLTWQVLPAPPPLPLNPLSMAYLSSYTGLDAGTDASTSFAAILTLGEGGTSMWLDLTDSVSVDAEVTFEAGLAATGFSFADVAGGQSVVDSDDGSVFIVGGTRSKGLPSATVLHVSASGVLQWLKLDVARLGAAATYVTGTGLYVFGGNPRLDGGATGAGGELLPANASAVQELTNVPADTATGAAAVMLDSSNILLAGGVTAGGAPAPVRLFSVASSGAVTAADTGGLTLPATLSIAQAFTLAPSTAPGGWSAMVVGTEASGVTSAYRVSKEGVAFVPFRVPRTHAQAIVLPNGSVGLVGGDATTLESFIP
jgi:hypothetical protein